MTVGIVTIHNSYNYGASLQCFALWKCISDMGASCNVINIRRPKVHKDYIPSKRFHRYKKRENLNVSIKNKIRSILVKIGILYEQNELIPQAAKDKMDLFCSKITLTQPYKSIDQLYACPPLYDLYITGSDQVWNPTNGCCIEPYFLTFVKEGSKCISYAPSIGVSCLEPNEAKDFAKWLEHYDEISVREEQGKSILEKLTDKKVTVMPDPTFLLTPEYWRSIAISPQVKGKYILLFSLHNNPSLIEFAKQIASQSGFELVILSSTIRRKDPLITVLEDAGPEEFLGAIANAEIVITDSFHGTVFSILLGANNFFSFIPPSSKRGSRIINLLSTFSLENHLVNLTENYFELFKRGIDREKMRNVIDMLHDRGINFLKQHIHE